MNIFKRGKIVITGCLPLGTVVFTAVVAGPLHDAVIKGRIEGVRFALGLEDVDVNVRDHYDCTPLYTAASCGYKKIAELLIGSGAEINTQESKYGTTPLYIAALKGNENMVQFLIDRGANVEAREKNGATSLHAAAVHCHLKVVQFLVAKNSGIIDSIERQQKATALHFAALNNCIETVDFLLSKGAGANTLNVDGWTPLHMAARKGFREVVDRLLASNASPSEKTSSNWQSRDLSLLIPAGSTVIDVARLSNHLELAAYENFSASASTGCIN